MKTDLITIAMPVFNRIEYFEEAIQSALQQTIQCRIIVMDNASTTSYFKEACKRLGVEYYCNESNLGVFGNWDRGLRAAKSPYCMILCDDDILNKEFVSRFLDSLKTHQEIDLYCSGFRSFGGREYNVNSNLHGMHGGVEHLHELKSRGPCIFATSIVYRREFYEKTLGFCRKGHGSYDWLWFYSNCVNARVYLNPEILCLYRKHETSDSDVNFRKISFSWPSIYFEAAKSVVDTDPLLARALERRGLYEATFCLRMASGKEIQEYPLNGLAERVRQSSACSFWGSGLPRRIRKALAWRINRACSIDGWAWWWNLP